ncbi:tetratricopeptide repeat protein [Sphingomonas arenae]|uniref:tetratricopeptide repeat protein n=1 Tax=Sphingomonas arenae TaxID=2812555 RepID=UPI001967BFFF|nr:tetratricopeptide repeat protein [Sphingomonas arenae]
MALAPGESSETFIREVDENLRRSQAEDFFKRWGGLIIGGVLLLLIAAAALLWWRQHQADEARRHSEELSAIIADIGTGKTKDVPQRLDAIAKDGNDVYRASALLTKAALSLQGGNRTAAIAEYRRVQQDGGLPEQYRNAALVRLTALEFDALKPEDVVSRLQPLAKPGNPWFGTAGELTAMALLKQNRRGDAGRMFASIAADKQVPQSTRTRAVQIAGTLGIDATAQLPMAEQQ